jgi:hypothetical protein
MIQELVITDLTRMSAGYVCVAGYANNGQAIRLATPRLHEAELAPGGKPLVFPGAEITCEVLEHLPDPPHTEDHSFDPYSLRTVRRLPDMAWQAVLERSVFKSVSDIFEQPITHDAGYYLSDGHGPRSLGAIRPRGLAPASYSMSADGTWSYRIGFYDQVGEFYRLKITDLTWNAYCEYLRGPTMDPKGVAAHLTQILKSRHVYLRVGLSRKWAKFPGRCYLQVNGVYTFPDYLDGLTFADLRPSGRSAAV